MDRALGKNVLFVRSEDEAVREMKFRSGRDVQPVCAPPDCKPIYYISEKGKMYTFRPYKGYYVLYELAHRMNNGRTLIYELQTTSGKHHAINIERLVYCTFVAGKYINKLKIEFKDGNTRNFDVKNLQVRDLLNEQCGNRMVDYTEQYKREFNGVVNYVVWRLGIDKEDARDVTEDAFVKMFVSKSEKRARNFVGMWASCAIEIGIDFWKTRARFQSIDHIEREVEYGEAPYEVDVTEILGDGSQRKCLNLQLQGASAKEIAEETGLTVATVGTHLHAAKKKLRNYLLTDGEIRAMYG